MGKRKREKKPVLTSPWKIGMLVALLLTATSFGVGYYMVKIYRIDLYWLSSDVSKWGVDSYEFFKEIYPAAAGVVLLSVMTYFVIASAVRRYRYYLNSGQDYRKMISLADSIDDLTNPAQIARLSEYPELQDVLRNYGDQIREISQGLETREQEMRSVDLEVEIDTILGGGSLNETLADGKWWASTARKVQAWVEENAGGSEAARQATARASLSCGKIVETASGASDDILDIMKSVGELNAVAEGLGSGGAGTPASTGPSGETMSALSSAASALEEKGAAIHDLSEESNGLALNIALMAARGEANEKDLAGLAEKVRSAAERFGKLGRELETLAKTVADSSSGALAPAGQTVSSSADPGAGRGIVEISGRIESRSRALQEKLVVLSKDVQDMESTLKMDESSEALEAEDAPVDPSEGRERTVDGSIVNFGAEGKEAQQEEEIDTSELVIDHGKLWEGTGESAPEEMAEEPEKIEGIKVTDDSGEFLISGFQEAMSAMQSDPQESAQEETPQQDAPQAVEAEDVVGEIFAGTDTPETEQAVEQPVVEQDVVEQPVEQPVTEQAAGREPAVEDAASAQDEWSDIQQGGGDDWMKVEVEKADEAARVEPEIIPVQETPAAEPEMVPEDAYQQEPPAVEPEIVPVEAATQEETIDNADEEPIYDLFELGAVECNEEAEVNL